MREPPMEEGKSMKTSVEDEWAGAVWGRTGCSGDESSGTLVCQTGSCLSPSGEDVQCSLGPPADTTVAVFNLLSPRTGSYYVSLVTGFNLPMTLAPGGSSNSKDECPEVGCPVDLKGGCPAELQVPSSSDGSSTIACRGPCSSNTTYQSCCAPDANGTYPPQGCTLSGHWFYFARSCNRARTYPSDVTIGNDGVCNSSTGYTITFCPLNIGKSSGILLKLAHILESRSFQEGWVSVFMLLTTSVSILLLLGFLRKSTSNEKFYCFTWAVYYSIPSVTSYGLGRLMQGDGSIATIYALWGLLLLTVLGSCGTISAFSLEDNDSAMRVFLEFIINSFLMGFLVARTASYLCAVPIYLFCIAMYYRIVERWSSLDSVCKNMAFDGVAKTVRIVADYMANDTDRSTAIAEEEEADPRTMIGYRYLVGLREVMSFSYNAKPPSYRYSIPDGVDKITIETIWHCQGELLKARDPGDRLKDICLSFSLFWLLLRRYAGYPLVEIESEVAQKKTWNFVRQGLMAKHIETSGDDECDRPFRVIETELSFMYDFFFTKNFTAYCSGLWTKLFNLLVTLLLYIYATFWVLDDYRPPAESHYYLGRVAIEVLVTKIILYLLIAIDFFQLITTVLISDWSKVAWVCLYVREQLWKSDSYTRMAIENLCPFSLKIRSKPWKRELGQQCLFKSHHKPIQLSPEVKRAVLLSLHKNEKTLTNGITSLQRNGVVGDDGEGIFSKVFQLKTQTHFILVWHIATSYCESIDACGNNANSNSNDFLVATSLSRYCAYLVAFVPELLPDPPNIAKVILEMVIKTEVNPLFEGCSSPGSKREKILGYRFVPGDQDKILHQGMKLGQSLVGKRGNDVWKVLAEFWAEYILFLAPSDNVAAHIKRLANGGEFITHLWALLTHAGILQREKMD